MGTQYCQKDIVMEVDELNDDVMDVDVADQMDVDSSDIQHCVSFTCVDSSNMNKVHKTAATPEAVCLKESDITKNSEKGDFNKEKKIIDVEMINNKPTDIVLVSGSTKSKTLNVELNPTTMQNFSSEKCQDITCKNQEDQSQENHEKITGKECSTSTVKKSTNKVSLLPGNNLSQNTKTNSEAQNKTGVNVSSTAGNLNQGKSHEYLNKEKELPSVNPTEQNKLSNLISHGLNDRLTGQNPDGVPYEVDCNNDLRKCITETGESSEEVNILSSFNEEIKSGVCDSTLSVGGQKLSEKKEDDKLQGSVETVQELNQQKEISMNYEKKGREPPKKSLSKKKRRISHSLRSRRFLAVKSEKEHGKSISSKETVESSRESDISDCLEQSQASQKLFMRCLALNDEEHGRIAAGKPKRKSLKKYSPSLESLPISEIFSETNPIEQLPNIPLIKNVDDNNSAIKQTHVDFPDICNLKEKLHKCIVKIERMPIMDRLLPGTKSGLDRDAKICELCEPKRLFLSKAALASHVNEKHINWSLRAVVRGVTRNTRKIAASSKNERIKWEDSLPSTETVGDHLAKSNKRAGVRKRRSKRATIKEPTSLVCNKCSKKFSSAFALKKHRNRVKCEVKSSAMAQVRGKNKPIKKLK